MARCNTHAENAVGFSFSRFQRNGICQRIFLIAKECSRHRPVTKVTAVGIAAVHLCDRWFVHEIGKRSVSLEKEIRFPVYCWGNAELFDQSLTSALNEQILISP